MSVTCTCIDGTGAPAQKTESAAFNPCIGKPTAQHFFPLCDRNREELWNHTQLFFRNMNYPKLEYSNTTEMSALTKTEKFQAAHCPPPQQERTGFDNCFGRRGSLGRWHLAREPAPRRLISEHCPQCFPLHRAEDTHQQHSPHVWEVNTFP